MNNDINSMEEAFKDLQGYSDAQFKTIENFSNEIARLKSENDSLKVMLSQNLPSLDFSLPMISNEQLICETQITILKERAIQKELNADEVRRFTQLYEVLEKIKKSAISVDDVVVNRMSNADLIKLVVNNESDK
jgi:hypothetical protein